MGPAQLILRAAARFLAPCIVLFAIVQLGGAQLSLAHALAGGFGLALGFALYVLVAGARAAARAAPFALLRIVLALALAAALAAGLAPHWPYAPLVSAAAAAFAVAAAAALALSALAGRAPTLRDAEW